MKTLPAHDLRITALVPRIRAVILAGLTAGVLATAPLTAQASVIFDFVPDDSAITGVAGLFEISEAAFDAREANSDVAGEVLDFSFEISGINQFELSFTSVSFSLADLGVGESDQSFILSVDSSGEFLSEVDSLSGAGLSFSDLILFNSDDDSFQWVPSTTPGLAGKVVLDICVDCVITIDGRFNRRTEVPEPGSLILFGVGLAGLALIRRRHRRGHR